MSPPRHPPGPLAAALRVARKELAHGFRDRQTLVYVVVLPLCLYPVLFWAMIQGVLLVQGRRQHTEVELVVAAVGGAALPSGLLEALAAPPDAEPPPPDGEDAPRALERVAVTQGPAPGDPGDRSAWPAAQGGAPADALLLVNPPQAEGAAPLQLYHEGTQQRSELARRRVEARIEALGDGLRARAARERGLEPGELEPFEIEERALDERADLGAYMLSFILPMLLVIATVLGAFVPAVDLTAGERERGTLETTMLLPVPRGAVHLGKVFAVCANGLVATVLNLLALGLSAEHLIGMLGGGLSLRIDLPLVALLAVLPLAILFSFTVSAVLAGVASLARSFKEGQALLGPVQMVFILPAMAGALPGLELTPGLALVPVLNVVLAFRGLIRGEWPLLELSLVALSLALLAALSVALCVRLLSREAVLVSDRSTSLARILSLLRGPGAQR